MLIPKRTKYRKQFRGRMKGKAHRGNTVTYGEFGLVATEPSWITSRQIEAARIAMTRYTKRGGKVWIKIFPDKPVSAKPIGTRQGSGKGAVEYWVAVVKPGRVMFEMGGISMEAAKEAMRLAGHKLPIKTKFVVKGQEVAAELTEKVAGLKEELFNLRFQLATGQLENPMRIREVKKTIARIKTVQREEELKAAKKA